MEIVPCVMPVSPYNHLLLVLDRLKTCYVLFSAKTFPCLGDSENPASSVLKLIFGSSSMSVSVK